MAKTKPGSRPRGHVMASPQPPPSLNWAVRPGDGRLWLHPPQVTERKCRSHLYVRRTCRTARRRVCREVVDGPWRGDSNVFARRRVTELPSLSQKPARVWRASSCIQTCAGWRPGRTAPPRRPRKVGPRRLTPHGTARSLGGCPERRNQMKAGPPLGSQAARAGGQAGGGGRGGSWEEPASVAQPLFPSTRCLPGPCSVLRDAAT